MGPLTVLHLNKKTQWHFGTVLFSALGTVRKPSHPMRQNMQQGWHGGGGGGSGPTAQLHHVDRSNRETGASEVMPNSHNKLGPCPLSRFVPRPSFLTGVVGAESTVC